MPIPLSTTKSAMMLPLNLDKPIIVFDLTDEQIDIIKSRITTCLQLRQDRIDTIDYYLIESGAPKKLRIILERENWDQAGLIEDYQLDSDTITSRIVDVVHAERDAKDQILKELFGLSRSELIAICYLARQNKNETSGAKEIFKTIGLIKKGAQGKKAKNHRIIRGKIEEQLGIKYHQDVVKIFCALFDLLEKDPPVFPTFISLCEISFPDSTSEFDFEEYIEDVESNIQDWHDSDGDLPGFLDAGNGINEVTQSYLGDNSTEARLTNIPESAIKFFLFFFEWWDPPSRYALTKRRYEEVDTQQAEETTKEISPGYQLLTKTTQSQALSTHPHLACISLKP